MRHIEYATDDSIESVMKLNCGKVKVKRYSQLGDKFSHLTPQESFSPLILLKVTKITL